MKAVLSGMDIPELRDEIDRLRVRKSELEDIIAQAQSGNKNIDPEQLEAYLSGLVSQLEKAPETVLKDIIKIYAYEDGSYTVNIGVHMNVFSRQSRPKTNKR